MFTIVYSNRMIDILRFCCCLNIVYKHLMTNCIPELGAVGAGGEQLRVQLPVIGCCDKPIILDRKREFS